MYSELGIPELVQIQYLLLVGTLRCFLETLLHSFTSKVDVSSQVVESNGVTSLDPRPHFPLHLGTMKAGEGGYGVT